MILSLMPRRTRLDAPSILHHVIIRGIERRPIFAGLADRREFFKRCRDLFPETGTACYAWALLTNHVHLLLRTGTVPLSKIMARLLSGYAASFNRRHRRSGHLFQNRYKSIICQEDTYFKDLVRYIHLNPLRAGLVPSLNALGTYPWAGHAPLLEKKECPWQDTEYTLSFFGNARVYLQFVEQGADQGQKSDLVGGGVIRSHGGWAEIKQSQTRMKGDERILGDTSFVMSILADAQQKLDRRYAMKQSGVDLDAVQKRVCDLYSLKADELYGRGRQKTLAEARSLFCFWAVRKGGNTAEGTCGALFADRTGDQLCRQEGAESPVSEVISYWRKGKRGVIYFLKNVPFLPRLPEKGQTGVIYFLKNVPCLAPTYDNLDRLLSATGTGTNPYTQSYTYDVIGNITYKSDVGSYSYTYGNKPHAVNSAGNITLQYDNNGNMTQRAVSGGDTLAITYNQDNMPTGITKNGSSYVAYTYDGAARGSGSRTSSPATPSSTSARSTR